jgi:hypothetical protein
MKKDGSGKRKTVLATLIFISEEENPAKYRRIMRSTASGKAGV